MSETEQTICPWCQTEIVWDEEIGPERYCPHCDNELSGYRTLQIGLDGEEDESEEEEGDGETDQTDRWEDDEDGEEEEEDAPDVTGLRQYGRERLALDETVESILEDQLEAPECPSCQEYMLEAGTQTISETSFQPRTPAALSEPLLSPPLRTVMYVCPSCFHTDTRLSVHDQERLVQLLATAIRKKS